MDPTRVIFGATSLSNSSHLAEHVREPSSVAFRVRRIQHCPIFEKITAPDDYDWDRLRPLLHLLKCREIRRDNHVGRELHQISCKDARLSGVSVAKTEI
jgi:hypothetical protein